MNTLPTRKDQRCSIWRMAPFGLALIAGMALGACAPGKQDAASAARNPDPIEGYWHIAAEQSTVFLEPCEASPDKLCGRLVKFVEDPNERDLQNPSLLDWGQKICGSKVIFDLVRTESPTTYAGRFYDPEGGNYLNLLVSVVAENRMDTRLYHGADMDEALNLAVSSAIEGKIPVFDTISLATRATIGKEHLGETMAWQRVQKPNDPCNTLPQS